MQDYPVQVYEHLINNHFFKISTQNNPLLRHVRRLNNCDNSMKSILIFD